MWTRRATLALVALLPSIALLSILGCGSVEDNSPTAAESATPSSASLLSAADITVNTTDDASDFGGVQQVADLPGPDGLVSLREAIIAANNTTGPQVIGFNIPTSDAGFDGTVFTIRPVSLLPALGAGETTIDGATQTAFTGNTNPAGPELVLNFGLISSGADGISLYSAYNVVRSLTINGILFGPCCGGTAVVISSPQATGNTVAGCVIGLDATGAAIVENAGSGIHIGDGATDNRIIGNVISGSAVGIGIGTGAADNIIQANLIGTDVTGTLALGNREHGVSIGDVGSNVVGGPTTAERNVISGNQGVGVILTSSGNTVQGNFIGTDVTGMTPLGNGIDGIAIADGNLIVGNLISDNQHSGISINSGNANTIKGNLIGTNINGNPVLGNHGAGVSIGFGGPSTPSTGNRIGGTKATDANVIAGNSGNGITIFDFQGLNNSISRNRIFSNAGLGIDLVGDGVVTANDAGDGDVGANNRMNFPILTSALGAPGQVVVKGVIDTPRPRSVTIEFFANPVPTPGGDPSGHGEGAVFLGTARPDVHGRFTATLPPVSLGTLITATATDAAGNTSEFAANVEARRLGHSLP